MDKNCLKANVLQLQLPLDQATTTVSTPLGYLEAIGLTYPSHTSPCCLAFEVYPCETLRSTSLSPYSSPHFADLEHLLQVFQKKAG